VGITPDDIIFLAGSTQDPEERLAIEAYQSLRAEFPQLRLIIVPRHTHRFDEVAALLDRSELAWTRRSKLGEVRNAECGMRNKDNLHHSPSPPPHPPFPILLVDTTGELGAWWGTATIGFVGGSLFSSR